MNLGESFRFAWRGVTAYKARSFLTMLGVLIGVASVIALVAVGTGASRSVTETLNKLGSNTLTVVPSSSGGSDNSFRGGPPRFRDENRNANSDTSGTANTGTEIRAVRLTLDDARALADQNQAPDVLGVAPVVTPQSVTATYGGVSHTVGSVTGTTASYLLINNDGVASGHEFGDSDYIAHSRVALLGLTVAKDLAGGDGGTILNKTINLNGHSFTVIGILTAKGSIGPQDQDDRILAPATAVQDTLSGYQNLSFISVKATSADTVASAQTQVERILDARHGTTAATRDFTISSSAAILSATSSITTIFTLLLGAIAAISLVVGGIGVMNIMLVTVTERTHEIGIRKAIGAGNGDIVAQFLIEAIMLSMFGGIVGILLGSLSSLVSYQTFRPVVTPFSILLAFSFALAVGVFFGLYPAKRAASLKPIDALRYE
jgi:putative ABC transport system permease protein